MERSRRQRPNPSSSSSSSTRSQSYRRFPSNPTQNSKSPSTNRDAPGLAKPRRAGQEDRDVDDPSNRPLLVGTCPFMCPAGERAQRERLRDLAVFERLDGNPRKTSSDLAVKKFCRTISIRDVQASDMRPLPVLEDTLDYLLSLSDSTEYPFQVVHDFIFDRTRSIRQDLSMQNIVNDKAIYMYEKMVKFHVISLHKLRSCSSDPNISSVHYLNMEQLAKALTSLFNLYDANRCSDSIYENEAEFHSFYVLLHLGSNSQPTGESLSLWFRHVPIPIIKSKEMCFARRILRFFRIGNYKRFLLSAAAEASYLQYCIIEPYISEVRALALSCINNGGYKLHPYPLAHLCKLLMMKESDLVSFCNACGLETNTDEAGNKLLPTKQTTFCCPKGGFQSCSFSGLQPLER
ncbi:SAC3 family protein C isoform X1 [Corylus avellana]|uniref:SAC3 family protein C isoform X1 n=1 Tax=Corylus avellana TaxID=13451 RepID=UPI00286A8556|nr:SAC3 family protein C isoform X1 [Corylus avellana]